MPPKQIFSDKEYLETKFKGIEEALERISEVLEKQGKRVTDLESDIGGAKMLGKAAMGLVLAIGGLVSWLVGFLPKGSFWGTH